MTGSDLLFVDPGSIDIDGVFRSNPKYELVRTADLEATERRLVDAVDAGDDGVAILRPTPGSPLTYKSVNAVVARLFVALQDGGRLPSWVGEIAGPGRDIQAVIAALVFAGVVEMQTTAGFASGVDARTVSGAPRHSVPGEGRLDRLSYDAVRYALRLQMNDPLKLSAQLYFFNRAPATPKLRQSLNDESTVDNFLGIGQGSATRALLQGRWRDIRSDSWRAWMRPDLAYRSEPTQLPYKLYVSPTVACLPEFFPRIVRAFTDVGVGHFKIGPDVEGLTRPDKLVAYFPSVDDLNVASAALAEQLRGCDVQGVPFTGDLGSDGLLSWGRDGGASGRKNSSWRVQICDSIAVSLLSAQSKNVPPHDAWEFACGRLALEGIDARAWTPIAAKSAEDPGTEDPI